MNTREQFALAIYCASIQSPLAEKIVLEGAALGGRNFVELAQTAADGLLAQLEKTAPITYRSLK